jgi:hypothetical protein
MFQTEVSNVSDGDIQRFGREVFNFSEEKY